MKTNAVESSMSDSWWIYLVRTGSGQLYCGITTDVERRVKVHASGKGAKYLRGKAPLTLEWSRQIGSRSLASQYEIRVKKLSKQKKEQLISQPHLFNEFFQ